ncbi:ABC transporter substrate-binding protein [Paenibacillus sp. S150]|uniref:ABC transporter substrate-binding protein n=1 Tax=Paenibacillus sp. S150 TaxID=2749826 RepID=UPI001C55BF39|nr:ABC transporter substrate-binding protein [Paenibacillus sp. S150]MBW4079878.1 carbohydrate ABC transporter substrate-binding protein [Paenibacillus sp. S150]
MKKSLVTVLLCCVVLAVVSACGNSTDSQTNSSPDSGDAPAEKAELTFYNFIQGYDAQMAKLVELYHDEHPNVTIINQSNGADYDKVLQTKIATGDIPDVFMSGPYEKNQLYAAASEDLTQESFWSEISEDAYPAVTTTDGKRIGAPLTTEAWGFLYNKDVFEKAGITELPKTLGELEAVIAKLKAIDVIPFGAGFKNASLIGHLHTFPYSIDGDKYPDELKALLAHEKKLTDFTFIDKIYNMMTLVKENTQDKPFDADKDPTAVLLAQGKVGMIVEAPYTSIIKADPNVRIGLMPVPLSEDPKDAKIYTSVGVAAHVGMGGKHVKEAKEFVDWLVTSDTAKAWWGNDMQSLSPIKGVTPVGNQLSSNAADLISQGDITSMWGYNIMPAGFADKLKPIAQKFLLDKLTKEQAIAEEQKVFDSYIPKEK